MKSTIYRKYIYILLLISIAGKSDKLCAQNFQEDQRAMHRFYQEQIAYKADVKVEIFAQENDKVPMMVKEASLRKNGNRFNYKIDETEMLMTEKELIMVNSNDKVVLYRKISKKEYEAAQRVYYLKELDSILSVYDSVQFHGIKQGKKAYTVFTSQKWIQKTELFLDADKNYLREVIYHYHPKLNKNVGKVEIAFLNTESNPAFTPDLFSENRFVVKSGKTIQLSPNYSKYRLNVVDYED